MSIPDIQQVYETDAKNINRLELRKIHVCEHCGEAITDQYIVRLSPSSQISASEYHTQCLNCESCGENLSFLTTCYYKNGRPYCKDDYQRSFAKNCAGCSLKIHEDEYVMKMKSYIYHVSCFRCIVCHVVLSSGDSFRLDCNRLLCRQHFDVNPLNYEKTLPALDDDEVVCSSKDLSDDCITPTPSTRDSISQNSKETYKPTRVRTVLSDKQVAILKTCYAANPRPDALMKEQLVELTGLSLRVIRVWFQNKRCKDKKKSVMIAKRTYINSYDSVTLSSSCQVPSYAQQQQHSNENETMNNQWLPNTSSYDKALTNHNSQYENYMTDHVESWYDNGSLIKTSFLSYHHPQREQDSLSPTHMISEQDNRNHGNSTMKPSVDIYNELISIPSTDHDTK